MDYSINHRVLVLAPHARHQAKVEDGQLPVVLPEQVSRMGIRVEDARFQQLDQKRLLRDGRQALDLSRWTRRELDAVDPLRDRDARRAELLERVGDVDAL